MKAARPLLVGLMTLTSCFQLLACQSPLSQRVMGTPSSAFVPGRVSQQSTAPSRQSTAELLSAGVTTIRTARFKKLDTNADQRLRLGEVRDLDLRLPGVISGFKDYDANGDGDIVLSEFLHADVIAFYVAFYDSIVEDNFFLSDLNRDRVLTGAERDELTQKLRPWPALNGGDADGDGMIDYAEYLKAYLQAEAG
jgi:hypothetical protein